MRTVVRQRPRQLEGVHQDRRRALAGDRCLGPQRGEGGIADVCIFDADSEWTVTREALRSQGKHTPFSGYEVPGRVRCTIAAGQIAYEGWARA